LPKSLLLLSAGVLLAQQPAIHFDGKTWWAHVNALAGDDM
jgi:hypothetical protein